MLPLSVYSCCGQLPEFKNRKIRFSVNSQTLLYIYTIFCESTVYGACIEKTHDIRIHMTAQKSRLHPLESGVGVAFTCAAMAVLFRALFDDVQCPYARYVREPRSNGVTSICRTMSLLRQSCLKTCSAPTRQEV